MTAKLNTTEWRIIGETVPGATHLRDGIPNQDAIFQLRESSRSLPLVLSVSDGHGSPKCFRSDRGSRFAVKESALLVREFLDEQRDGFDLDEIESKGKEYLPQELVRRWREAVETHLKNNPFTDAEFERMEEKSGAGARKLVEENPFLAYGATSLTVAVEETFILYLQLGDGDIMQVSEKAEVTKALPEDERLFANETTSLCLPKAEKDFRFFLQRISKENCPALIMLSTDGYVNSFVEEAGFLKAATDFFEMLGSEGYDFISENLKTWLEETTQTGSGDDTTVGIIYRPDALKKPGAPEHLQITASDVSAAAEDAENSENSIPLTPENMEDVTVTITIKKDKNKKSAPLDQMDTKQNPQTANDKSELKEV